MRRRFALVLSLLLLPALADAQRTMVPRRGPARPAPMPPQAPAIAREYSYVRLPYSVESYPFISQFSANGFVAPGIMSNWTAGGIGTRLDYRLSSYVSLTLDATGDVMGGPARTRTLEIGTRLRTKASERRLHPYVDARFGYLSATDSYVRPFDYVDPYTTFTPMGPGTRYSDGWGALGGVGMEYRLTNWVSLTSSASAMQSWMSMYRFQGNEPGTTKYTMRQYRYTVGVRFHPVKLMGLGQEAFAQQVNP
jgi:hypothetical protein